MIAKTLSTSQKYASLNTVAGKRAEFCQAMFPLLVAHADDFGRLAGDVFTVKHAVCPTSPRRMEDVEAALESLHAVNLVIWYEADSRKCLQIVDFDKHQSGLHKRTKSEFPEHSGKFPEVPAQGKGRELKGTEENRREGNGAEAPTAPLVEVPTDADATAPECKVEAVVHLWNEITASKLPACRGLSDSRRKHIRARMKEYPLGVMRDVMERAARSAFCGGRNNRGWVLTFDWLMESGNNFLKVLEGKYDDRPTLVATGTEGRGRTGAPPRGKYDGIEEQD